MGNEWVKERDSLNRICYSIDNSQKIVKLFPNRYCVDFALSTYSDGTLMTGTRMFKTLAEAKIFLLNNICNPNMLHEGLKIDDEDIEYLSENRDFVIR